MMQIPGGKKHREQLTFNTLWPSDATETQIWVNFGSGNGLLPDVTKPLPEPKFTHHQ